MAKFNEQIIHECEEWVSENGLMEYGGAKLKEFCSHFCIDNKTYYNWLENSDFSDAIKKGKECFKNGLERNVVSSLARSAIGYEYEEVRTEYQDVNGKPQIKRQIKTKKNVEPNVGAGIFLLTNLAPDRWKNKQNTEHSGEVSTGLTVVVKNQEEADLINKLKKF